MSSPKERFFQALELMYAVVTFWLVSEKIPPLRLVHVPDSLLDELVGLFVGALVPLFTVGRARVDLHWKVSGEDVEAEVWPVNLAGAPVQFIYGARLEARSLFGHICLRWARRTGAEIVVQFTPSRAVRLIEQNSTEGAVVDPARDQARMPLRKEFGLQGPRVFGSMAKGAFGLAQDRSEVKAYVRLIGKSTPWPLIRVQSSVQVFRIRSVP